jgi:hypothetical protein
MHANSILGLDSARKNFFNNPKARKTLRFPCQTRNKSPMSAVLAISGHTYFRAVDGLAFPIVLKELR